MAGVDDGNGLITRVACAAQFERPLFIAACLSVADAALAVTRGEAVLTPCFFARTAQGYSTLPVAVSVLTR